MQILEDGARRFGISLSSEHLQKFERYYQELMTWNERFNLTAITGREAVQLRHFLDSLTCLLAVPPGSTPSESRKSGIPDTVPLQVSDAALRLADLGTGAGFPGIPLKLMLGEAELTLVESTRKKVEFLRHIVKVLELKDVEVVRARAEALGQEPEHRDRYDVVTARAVAHMAVLAEYCLPFCRIRGRMIAPKGAGAHQEVEEAVEAIEMLGGELVAIKPIALPGLDREQYLVVVEKTAPTPTDYPRRTGIPSKRPLL